MNNKDYSMNESMLMAREVNLAGEFIYAGLEKMNSMKSLDEPTESFFVLYHLAVGIERLQKVLIVLLEEVQYDNIKAFLESIKVHNHRELATRIKTHVNIDFSKEQNAFLNMLADFYENHRYEKYDFYGYEFDKLNDLSDFLKTNYKNYDACYTPIGGYFINDEIKEYIGRIVGRIGQKYYKEIQDVSHRRNIFAYELVVDSPAYKIFMTTDSKNSYQKEIEKEENAIKELIIYMMNSKADNTFFRFLRDIKPLDIDPGLIENYVTCLCKKKVLTDLIDEIECNYYEMDNFSKEELKERKEMLDAIANDNVCFWLDDEDEDEEEE